MITRCEGQVAEETDTYSNIVCELQSSSFEGMRVRTVLLRTFFLVFCIVLLARPADPMDCATQAADAIRPGVPAVDRQLAIDLLTGLGLDVRPVVEELTLSANPLRRAAGLEVMGNWGVDANAFSPFLEDPSYVVRKIALEGIQNAEARPDDPEMLAPLLEDAFWPVRCAAIRALAVWPCPGFAAHLFKKLEDPDPRVRHTALQCMDLLRDEVSSDELEEAVQGLSARESRLFMKACVPLVREANLAFFETRAERAEDVQVRTTARFIVVAHTRKVPEHWIPELLDLALDGSKEIGDAAGTLLIFAGEAVADAVRARFESDESADACDPALLFSRLLRNAAIPSLSRWIRDEGLREPIRLACLDGLLMIDSEAAASAFAQMAPDLNERFRQRVMEQTTTLASHRSAQNFTSFFQSVIAGEDDALSCRAFLALCLYDNPPTDRLIEIFLDEDNADRRRSYASNMVKLAKGKRRDEVVVCLLDELTSAGPAAGEAAQALPSIAGPEHRDEVTKHLRQWFSSSDDPGERQRLLFGLLELDPAGTDHDLAERLEEEFDQGNGSKVEYLVTHLDSYAGEATADAMCRIFPEARPSLKEEILRTLVRRSDDRAMPWLREVFASATISYKRSVMIDLAAAPELAMACEEYLRSVLRQERDVDLLASAIQAAPSSLLEAEEDHLLTLAAMGPELGMETVDALFHAMALSGTERSRNFLLRLAEDFIDKAIERKSPRVFDSAQAGPAETALLSLARAKDESAVPLLARMLFLHAHVMRRTHILELWSSTSVGVTSGASHKEARAVLDGLLLYDDAVVEPVILRELDQWATTGRLFQCGDATFCTVFRELLLDPRKSGRLLHLAERLEALTLVCAPANSPSDFRVHRLQAIEADPDGDPGRAAKALRKACHVLKFYPPARKVLRDVFGDPDRFKGNDPFSVLMSDRFLCEAAQWDKQGDGEKALQARRMAQRFCPFR